jgi:hypothetical protein
MKNLIKISLLIMTGVVFCNAINAQGRASDKSFTTVLNEIKQHQAMRNKMLQQMRQATPANNASQNNVNIQAANTTTATTTAQPSVTAKEGTSQQGANNRPLNKTVIQPARVKKQ